MKRLNRHLARSSKYSKCQPVPFRAYGKRRHLTLKSRLSIWKNTEQVSINFGTGVNTRICQANLFAFVPGKQDCPYKRLPPSLVVPARVCWRRSVAEIALSPRTEQRRRMLKCWAAVENTDEQV